MAELLIEHAVKAFGGARAVADVSLRVADGDFAVLLGPSGCGKTTLLRLVAGFETLDNGRVLIGGVDVSHSRPGDRDVAMVFQGYALYPHMTVFDNIAFGLRALKIPRREIERRVQEVAATVGIDGLLGRRPGTLSGGQRQRVALARAISRQPQLFLMDEPLSNLDTQLRATMRTELKRLQQELGATVLYVTHDQIEAMTMGTQVAVLRDGKVEQEGAPQVIYQRPANDFVATFLGAPPMCLQPGAIRHASGGVCFEGDGVVLPLPPEWAGEIDRAVHLGVRPEDIQVDARGNGTVPIGRGQVEMTEPMGHETVVHVRVGAGALLTARCPGVWAGTIGQTVEVGVDPQRAHLFEIATGEAIVAPSQTPVGVGEPT